MDPINASLLKRLVRALEKSLPQRADEHIKAPKFDEEDTTKDGKEEPPIPSLVIADFVKELKEQYRTDQKNNHTFQKRSLTVQILLCWFTACAFVAAGYYACTAKQQLRTMDQTNVAQQRAVLRYDSAPFPLQFGGLGIKIKNEGRIAAILVKCTASYIQGVAHGPILPSRKDY